MYPVLASLSSGCTLLNASCWMHISTFIHCWISNSDWNTQIAVTLLIDLVLVYNQYSSPCKFIQSSLIDYVLIPFVFLYGIRAIGSSDPTLSGANPFPSFCLLDLPLTSYP
jgi:hypothetical protein